MRHIVYTRDKSGNETIWVDGKKTSEGFRPGDFSGWSDQFYLRLGNENGLAFPWKGSFYVVAVYNKALSADDITRNYSAGPRDDLKNGGISYNINVYPNPARDLANIENTPRDLPDITAPHQSALLTCRAKFYMKKTSLIHPPVFMIKYP
jgi:hypothetical protein